MASGLGFPLYKDQGGSENYFLASSFSRQDSTNNNDKRYASAHGPLSTGQRECPAPLGDIVVRRIFCAHGLVWTCRKRTRCQKGAVAHAGALAGHAGKVVSSTVLR